MCPRETQGGQQSKLNFYMGMHIYTGYVFNIEKYTHINPGIYLAIFNFLLPVTAVQIGV